MPKLRASRTANSTLVASGVVSSSLTVPHTLLIVRSYRYCLLAQFNKGLSYSFTFRSHSAMRFETIFRLPTRFIITLSGNLADWRGNPVPHDEMTRMLLRMFAGETASRGTFERWNMQIEIEEDTDQGPEA